MVFYRPQTVVNAVFRAVFKLFFLLLFLSVSAEAVSAESNSADFIITDKQDNDISVKVYPAESEILVIWLVDHKTHREMFENMLLDVNRAGMEIWRVDLLSDYFLTRSNENQRTLSGDGVEALLQAAHQKSHKHILLAGYDRMPLAIMRGIYQWQQSLSKESKPEESKPEESNPANSKLAGSVFFYPNLYGPTPVAGEDPELDPIVDVTTTPVVIYQPDSGYQRWRITKVMERLWAAGSQAFIYLVPNVRDWFFMGGEIDHGTGDKEATARLPGQLIHFTRLMADLPTQAIRKTELKSQVFQSAPKELVPFADKPMAPGFELGNELDVPFSWQQYQGKVTLVNFWATWCPPCVEEIPSLNALQANYLDSEFEIVSINYRETAEQLNQFSSEIPINFPVLMDYDGKVSLQWKVFSFPSSFLVDKQGRIRYSINLAIDWNSEDVHKLIDELLDESVKE